MKVYIGPPSEDGETQEVDVQIDDYDLWNFDISIAHIIHPFLVEFRKTYRGAPYVYNMDVWDENLWETNEQREHRKKTGEEDPNFFKRWEWVLDEMIWAFNEIRQGSHPEEDVSSKEYYDRIQHGTELFGKYFTGLWS